MHLPASRWIARAWAPAVAVGVAGLTAACSGPAAQLDGVEHVWPTFWFYDAEDEILGLALGTLVP